MFILMALAAACSSSQEPGVESCADLACRQAWAVEHFSADPRAVRDLVVAQPDELSRASIVEAVVEAWPATSDALCGLLEPGITRARCEFVHARPHLWLVDPGRPQNLQQLVGEAVFTLAPSPGMRPVTVEAAAPLPCGESVPEHSCREKRASEQAMAGDLAAASALCVGIESEPWRSACLMESVRQGCTRESPAGCGVGVELCLAAERLRPLCLVELVNELAALAPPSEERDGDAWAAIAARLREVERRTQPYDVMLAERINHRVWAEALMLSYGQSRIPAGDPLDFVPAMARPHVRAAIAWRQAIQKNPGNLRARADLVEEGMARRFERIGAMPMPQGRVEVTGYWAETLPGEEEIAWIPYLQNARRAWSPDPAIDARLVVLEAAARVLPVDTDMLVEGLGADEVVVRWTAARLLGQVQPGHPALQHVRGDADPRVRARATP